MAVKSEGKKKVVKAKDSQAAVEQTESKPEVKKKAPKSKESQAVVDERSAKFAKLLHSDILDVFKQSYNEFTNVQVRAGIEMLTHNDVVVESPTGSGKTLAFLLPALTIMRKRAEWKDEEIGCLVLSPSRELAVQITQVATPFCEKLGYKSHITTGGKKLKPQQDLQAIKEKGCNLLVATPGRLEQLLSLDKDQKLRRMLKSVEVLIIDEADRFTEAAFATAMNEIMSAVPKQRRTGLFSATQAKEREDLIKFPLRTPVTIKLKEQSDIVCPVSLTNYYTICDASQKLLTLLEFIRNKADKKIIVFLSSCQCVSYFHKFFPKLIKKRPIFAVHGKKQSSRTTQIEGFRKSDNGIMLCTDVMSRGIDIDDIDWVIQFDVPRTSSWFVHRAGRTARSGREGNALILLTKKETAYVQFLENYEKVKLEEIKVKTVTELKSEQLMEQLRKMATSDREVLEAGTRAYVSFIESYARHDCHIVCQLKDLDVVGLAHSYGLLRMPRMAELNGRTEGFKRSEVDTSTIKYLDGSKEKSRVTEQAKKMEVNKKRKEDAAVKKERIERKRKNAEAAAEAKKDGVAKKKKMDEEGMDDFKLIKKMKKGRLTKKEIKNLE